MTMYSIIDNLVETKSAVRVRFYDGIGLSDTIWTGTFVVNGIDSDSNEGYVSFEHIETEAKRLQCVRSYMFFPVCKILTIDVLSPDYDRSIAFECPHCGEPIALEETVISKAEDIISQENEVTEEEKCSDFKNPLIV